MRHHLILPGFLLCALAVSVSAVATYAQDAAESGRGLLHEVAQRAAVDAGDRNVGAQAVDDQKPEGEENPLLELGGLAEGPPAHVRGHLLCCRCHALSLS